MEQDFQRINQFLNEKIAGVKQYEKDLYAITPNYERELFNDVFNVVQKSIMIDKEVLK